MLVVPRLFLAGTPTRGPAVVAFKRTSQGRRVDGGPIVRAQPVDPAQFLSSQDRCGHRSRPGTRLKRTHPRVCSGHAFNAPTAQLGRFRPFFECSGFPRLQGRQALHPLPRPADGVVILEPCWERPAGTQNTLAPNGGKLRQLRCARQGLVRVPESNTKYGGKRGITGGDAAPVMRPSISES
jgi:hypothetical protein